MYQDLMFNALLNDQYEFVNLLLENGFSIKKFLTYNRYKKLFIRKFNSISLITKLFRKLFNKDTNSDFDSIDLKLVGCCIEKLVDNLFEHEFSSQSNFKDLGIEKLNNPEYHLFIFNLLLGREQLSEIFWKIGEVCCIFLEFGIKIFNFFYSKFFIDKLKNKTFLKKIII